MRAIVLRSHGGPEVLGVEEVADPEPGPEEVLVDVVATALNRADILQRMGFYPGPPMAHEIPGLEFAGRVAATGARTVDWEPGDAVMGIVGGGAYAERLVVHERQVMAVPLHVAVTDAAAIPEVFITAWDALVLQGGLTSGRWALVHAGGSGVGTAAIQIARAIGARVAVTASTGKLARCRDLGANLAIERSPHDWLGELREHVAGGVDVVLDVVGGDEVDHNVDALGLKGRIVQVGTLTGGGRADVSKLMRKRAAVIGTLLRARPIEEKISVTQRFAHEVLPLFDVGALHPVIDRRFPLAEAAEAHRYMESNANVGKILLDVSP
ncbi:MAG TPA: NAD(P)H-quinone oxidoreductase [Acidimicrobiales bacterium]|nr:NAD(P)H-quinone oxidoreductase [Acidimicrobiales bacterium]